MHKDQRRIKSAFLPRVMDRVMGETPGDERDCTILNRCFLQGPDPLFLMETCPEEFNQLCGYLYLLPASGRDAIERAHWQGPGVLLVGTGIDSRAGVENLGFQSEGWKREALWLVLASVSDTTEEDYKPEVSMVDRLRRVTRAAISFSRRLWWYSKGTITPADTALEALAGFDESCVWTRDENGIPVCDEDAGFYIGYKKGWKVCGVRHGNKVFYGTTPDTTLDEQGVKVDEKVSESYGFVRVQDTAAPT